MESIFAGQALVRLGVVSESQSLVIHAEGAPLADLPLVDLPVAQLVSAWKRESEKREVVG